jgi:hypothetical protein
MEVIGYTPLDGNGKPVRPHKSGYSWEQNLTHPPRIYTTLKRAKGQSPVGLAAKVYIETVHEDSDD